MIFFEKVTKHIAFARDFRYTVTRIAPATCRFCALLPKQLTPRQGTKTYTPLGILSHRPKQLTPRQGTKTQIRDDLQQTNKKQFTPRQGTKTSRQSYSSTDPTRNDSRPARGRKKLLTHVGKEQKEIDTYETYFI